MNFYQQQHGLQETNNGYTDRLHEPLNFEEDDSHRHKASSSFPGTLYFILQESDGASTNEIVGWKPHGRCFRIHNEERFVEEIMSRYV